MQVQVKAHPILQFSVSSSLSTSNSQCAFVKALQVLSMPKSCQQEPEAILKGFFAASVAKRGKLNLQLWLMGDLLYFKGT